jgi:hypothetical protein
MDKNDAVANEVCTDIIQRCIQQQRYRLKKAYWAKIKNLTPEQAYLKKPDNIDESSWKELVNRWFDEQFQVTDSNLFYLHVLNYILSNIWKSDLFY